MQTVAAVTTMHGDAFFLNAWLRHYERQIGRVNCFLLNAGAGPDLIDLTDQMEGCSVIRLPQDAGDVLERKRGRIINNFVAALRCYFTHVIVTEPDELLVVDPASGADLDSYLQTVKGGTVLTPLGLEVIHRIDRESEPVNDTILGPRRHVRPAPDRSKPCILSTDADLSRNGQMAKYRRLNTPDPLYLMGLKYCDRTVSTDVPDEVFQGLSELTMLDGFDLSPLRRQMHDSWARLENSRYWQFDRPANDTQYVLPERFTGLF